MKKLLVVLALSLNILAVSAVALPRTAQAAVAEGCSTSFLGLPVWYRYLDVGPRDGDPCAIYGPTHTVNGEEEFHWEAAIGYVAIAILESLLRIGSLVAVGYVMLGGFRYITSQGDPEGAKSARQTIINAIIGLVITIASASIVSFTAHRLTAYLPLSNSVAYTESLAIGNINRV